MKNSLKETEKVTNTKLKEINKVLKESPEKQVEKNHTDNGILKTKIETIRKTQTEGILVMENLNKRTEASHSVLE